MLPNWLYGKSKSKLASILGGGGGTPADYEQVKAQVTQNAEDIELLSDALDDKAALTQLSNPNILHNPWFQVNQRGVSSTTANGYFVDRWITLCASTGSTTYTLNSDGTITIDNSLGEAPAYFIQRRTAKTISRVTGKKITVSVMLSDGSVRTGSGTYVSTDTAIYYEDEDIKLQSNANTSGQFFVLRVEAGKSITIKALKFELGEISTLAMDTAPDIALELAKCRRYFYKTLQFDDNGANISPNQCLAVSTTRLQGIKFPAEMRANPTVTINKVNELDSSTAITGVTSQWISKEGISYFIIANATVGNLYVVDFEASAEL